MQTFKVKELIVVKLRQSDYLNFYLQIAQIEIFGKFGILKTFLGILAWM